MNGRLAIAATFLLVLAGCAARSPAPVVDRMPTTAPAPTPPQPVQAPVPKPVPTHTIKRGETLVSIALQYGLDYRELAAWNGIPNPARISVGQVLVLAAPVGMGAVPAPGVATGPVATPLNAPAAPIEARPLANTPTVKVEPRGQKLAFSEKALAQLSAGESPPAPAPGAAPETAPVPGTPPAATPPAAASEPARAGTDKEDIDWMWPTRGKVLAPFTEATKGMDIAGRKGAPVLAAASGRVIYADAGLRGYGKLVIIRHNNTWLSAYAHNDKLLVAEQQEVKKGQKIAEMGSSDADQVKLHFEIRRQGKPVDPVRVLPAMTAR